MGPRGHLYLIQYDHITKYNIRHTCTSFQHQVKLYMYNEYYVKTHQITAV